MAEIVVDAERNAQRDRLMAFVAGRDVGCPACEYNLRDLQTDVCPECGAPLDLGTILAADPDFPRRKRRLVWAAGTVLAVGFIGSALVGVAAHGGGVRFIVLPPIGAFVSLVATAVALLWDSVIYADRIRYPRARDIPSFGPVVRLLVVVLWIELAADVVLLALALL